MPKYIFAYSFFVAGVILYGFIFSPLAYAVNSSFKVIGGTRVGEDITITVQVSGGNCGPSKETKVVEIAMTAWAGVPEGYAIDLENASMTASINGSPINGTVRHVSQKPAANDIILHPETPFIYHTETDIVNATITGAKRQYPADSGLHFWLLTQPRGDYAIYAGCIDAYALGDSWKNRVNKLITIVPTNRVATVLPVSSSSPTPSIIQKNTVKTRFNKITAKTVSGKKDNINVISKINIFIKNTVGIFTELFQKR